MRKSFKKMYKLVGMAIVVAMLSVLLVSVPVFAASLTSVSATVSPTTVSTSTEMTVTFTNATEIPTDGKIVITALDFTWADDSTVANTPVTDDAASVTLASVSASQSDKKVTITLNASAAIAASSEVVVVLGGTTKYLTNPTAGTYTVNIETKTSADAAIDDGLCQVTVGTGQDYGFDVSGTTLTMGVTAPTSESNIEITRAALSAGTDLTTTASSSWAIVDARGGSAGWCIKASVGTLDNSSGASYDLTPTSSASWTSNANYYSQIKIVKSGTADGSNDIVHTNSNDGSGDSSLIAGTAADGWMYLTGSELTIVNAAVDEGLGAFTITPDLQITIPAGVHAGTFYIPLTVTIYSAADSDPSAQ